MVVILHAPILGEADLIGDRLLHHNRLANRADSKGCIALRLNP